MSEIRELEYDPLIDHLCGLTASELMLNEHDALARNHAAIVRRKAGVTDATLCDISIDTKQTVWWYEDANRIIRHFVVGGSSG